MPKLGDSQEFKDIVNSLRDIASEANNADKAVDELGDGVREALQAMQKLGIIKNALKPTEQAVEAARQAFAEFNSELGDDYESVTQLIRADKDFQKYLRGVVGETEALSNAQKKHKKATKEDTAAVKALGENMKNVLEQVQALKKAMDTGGINVKINNAGFTKVLDEMARAVDNFKRRKGNAGKNFFDAFTGSREENLETSQRVITDAKTLTDRLENVLGDSLTETLSKKLKDSISTGILKGVEMGVSRVQEIDPTAKLVGSLLDETNASQPTKARVLQTLLGKKDETAIALERVKQNAKARIQYRQIEADRQVAVDKQVAAMQYIDANPNSNQARYWKAHADKEELSVEKERRALAADDEKKQRDETNRIRNMKEAVRIQKEMNEVVGEEGSKLQKLGQDLVSLNAKRREYLVQGDELNKINFAEVANNQRLITKKTQEWAAEVYKVEHHYYQIEKVGKALVNTLKFLSSTFQTTSATLSSLGGIWSTMRTSATQFFTFFTNSFRRVFSQAKSMALSLFKSGLEQRKKIEQAQIGFASFFGEDRVDAVTQAVRREAAKTPIVNAGDLADYVMQLAPVSQGNASLALNSSLGILKSLVYSGSDISEGEYVIKNIRDVIAKGTATAIDIRQFNRALPGLETALKKMPDLANFIDENGKLSITKQNVGQVLDVFAKLNTDENSPLKQIEEKMLHTLDGMEKLFNEKKTTAMETILEKSGVFDLLYKALGLATDDGLWKKIADFVGNSLQPIVGKLSDILTNTDWSKIGKKLQEFWSIIKSGITDAKEAILGAGKEVLGDDPEPMFKRIASIIASLIRGIGNGVAEAMRFAKWLANMLSGGDLEKLAENIGKWLISPLGKIVQTIIGLGANSFGAASRALSTMSKFVEMFNKMVLGGINKNAVRYGQAYARMYASGDAFGNTMATNMLLSGGAKSYSGSTKIKTISAGGATVELGKFKQGVSTAATALKTFGSRLLSGVSAGGVVFTIGSAITEVTKSLGVFGDKTESVADVMGTVTAALTGAVAGGMITGSAAGGLIGAIIGAGIALNNLAMEADKARVAEEKKRLASLLGEGRQQMADSIVQAIQEAGITEFDKESEEGRYAYNELLEYLSEFDDLGMVDMAKAEGKLLQALKDKKVAQQLYEYSNSDEYNNLGGRTLDLDKDKDYRDRMAKFIEDNKLLGTDYDYSNTANERVVKDWLNGDSLTDKQVDALTGKYSELSSTIGSKTTDLAGRIDNNSKTIKDAEAAVDANTAEMDRLRQAYTKGSGAEAFVKGLMNYDEEVGKALYTSGDKTWGLGDIFDFINQKIEQTGDKSWATLGTDLLNGYQSGDMTTSQIFRYMMKKYGDQGFEEFFNSHGISSTKDSEGNETKSSVQNYIDATKDTGFLKNKVQQFEMLLLTNFAREFNIDDPEIDSQVKRDLESGLLNDEQKQKLYNRYLEIGKEAFEEYKKEHQEAAEKANEYYSESAPPELRGKKRVRNVWWDALGLFGYHAENHGGYIKPIYRATGGELGVDTVPAMLQPGEFVMRRASVAKAGLSTMFALNRGDMAAAARSLGAKFSGNYNNSRNWSNVVNNNQRTQTNYIKVMNRNASSRLNSYYGLANRIALS